MATVVDDSTLVPNSRNRKYDWDSWLDGRTWKLTKGEDFHCDAKSFRSSAAAATKRLRPTSKLVSSISGDSVTIRVEG